MGEIAKELLINVITAAVIFAAGWWIAKQIRSFIVTAMQKKGIDAMIISFTSIVVYFALVLFVIMAALNQLGIQTTSFIAIIGAAGLAVALSLQDSLANFAAGIMIVFFRWFKVGDFIEAGGTTGIVENIQIFSTQLRTPDNKLIIVPNSNITSENIINYSARSERRVDMVFSIGYDDDIRKARQILQEIIDKDERVLKDPEPTIAVSELGDNSVNIICWPWVKTDDYWPFYWETIEAVKLRFDEENITIPYPQRDVHLHQVA